MTATATTLYDEGIAFHRAGQLVEAEQAYLGALQLDDGEPRATQMLGVLAFQTGRAAMAVDLLRRAADLAPESAECFGNLGLVLAAGGRSDDAVAAYRRAIAIKPDFAEAHLNLGTALQRSGDTSAAADAYRRAITACPDLPEAHYNLGLLLAASGRLAGAVASLRRASDLRPADVELYLNLADTSVRAGDLIGAVRAYRRAVALQPDRAEAHYNLAVALHGTGHRADAIAAVDRALQLRPDWPEAWNNLGVWLHEVSDLTGATRAFTAAIRLRPDYADPHSNLASVHRAQGRVTDAIAGYRHALTLRPDHVEAMSNLGATLTRAGDLDAAIDVLRRAIDLAPELTEAHNNLGNALKDVGDLDGAIAAWQQALALRPDDAAVHSNLVYTVLYHPDADGDLHRAVAADWAARHANPLTRAVAPHAAARRGDGRIKVGYVAPDFRDHCQSFFTLPLLSNHDRDRFEIVCYADVAVPDAVTHRLQGCVEGWRETAGLSDAELADRIRADGVDVLVDLTVHMAHHRLLTFARRPAPVQVTWLGYPGTTGLEAIDYRLSDPHLDPPDHDRFYAERTLRLPDTFWCYDPLTDGPDVNDLPANATGHVTFGCLNNFCKVTDPTLDLWARAMTAVPGSRLLLLAPEGSARRRVTGHLARHGITPDRLDFVGRRSRHAYLQAYQRIDIGLDTFPYNGHTTTLDACWMGVPVVTKVGASAVARAGWSQLSNLNLRHLAAHTDDGFVATAVALAADLPRLSTLRRSLRPRLALSPLCDGPRFARHVESAYTAMVAAAGVRQMLQNATVSHTENAPLDSDKQPLEKRLGEATGVRLG